MPGIRWCEPIFLAAGAAGKAPRWRGACAALNFSVARLNSGKRRRDIVCTQAEAEEMPREERSRWKRQRKLKMRREQEGRSRGRIKQEGGEKRAGAGMPQSSGQGSKRAASSLSCPTNQTQTWQQLIFLAREQKDSFHASNPRAAMPRLSQLICCECTSVASN